MLTKKEIIKKIKELAKENDGATPSEKNFYAYAEIGLYDIQKLGWSHYGELVHEVGLTPNKFDKTKYSNKQLCDMFIEIIREKNKWPTRGELDVKHHMNSDFPASSTFYNKFGLTRDLANTILEYVEDKKELSDIAEICNLILKDYENKNESSEGNASTKGFVYLGKQHGKYKIGMTNDLNRRREDITLLGSEPIKWIHAIETDDMRGVEKYWHDRFKQNKGSRGEWFNLNSSDVKAFKRWKKIY